LWGSGVVVGVIVPRMPGLIWVLDRGVGDVMVDRSFRGERLRPLVLRWIAAVGRVSRELRELAGGVGVIGEWWAGRKRSAAGQVMGSSASGPRSRRV